MALFQVAGVCDSGDVVSIGMVCGKAQLPEARRQAELQECALCDAERDAIQHRRADAAERERSQSIESERRAIDEAELHVKSACRRLAAAADSAEEDTADEEQQRSAEQLKPRPGELCEQTSLKGQKTGVREDLLAKLPKRQAAAEQDDESGAVAVDPSPVKMAQTWKEASKQAMARVQLPNLLHGGGLPVAEAMDCRQKFVGIPHHGVATCGGQHQVVARQPALKTHRGPEPTWWPETVAARSAQRSHSEPASPMPSRGENVILLSDGDEDADGGTQKHDDADAGGSTQKHVRFRTNSSQYEVTTPYALVYGKDHHPRDFDFDRFGEKVPRAN